MKSLNLKAAAAGLAGRSAFFPLAKTSASSPPTSRATPPATYTRRATPRGNAELMIRYHKLRLKSDRSSCLHFVANKFWLFLHSAVYILVHALQKEALQAT